MRTARLPTISCGSSGDEGAMLPPPRPVKISRKKEGRQWRPHRFHVSRPPLPGCWIRYCVVSQFQKVGLVLTPQVPCLEGVGRYPWTYPSPEHTHPPTWTYPFYIPPDILTRDTPVNRQTTVKTLPSRNFVCGR